MLRSERALSPGDLAAARAPVDETGRSAGVYLLIAGTYTPVALLALRGAWRPVVLIIIWAGAFAAIVLKFAWVGAPKWLAAAIGIALGWVAVVVLPQLVGRVNIAAVILLIVGGLAYTLGAVVYVRRRPDPVPAVFGYHELFHALTIVGVAVSTWRWVLHRSRRLTRTYTRRRSQRRHPLVLSRALERAILNRVGSPASHLLGRQARPERPGRSDRSRRLGAPLATIHAHGRAARGFAAGQRIAGMLGPASLWHRTCSVSCAQPEQ